MRRMTVLAAVAAAFGTACSDRQTPLSPPAADAGLSADIVDGHTDPNRSQFFFLTPIRPTRLQPPSTGFNGSLRPVVEIYQCTLRLDRTGCGTVGPRVSRLTMDDPSAIDRLYVVPALKKYVAGWRTVRVPNLDATKFYRIQVKVGSTVLGYADVDIVRTLWQLLGVDRDDFVPTLEDLTLPIAFWIGDGALCDPVSVACISKTIKLVEGGAVQLLAAGEDFRLNIPAGTAATSDGLPVTDVTFSLGVCDGIDVDLATFGQCLRVTTLFATLGRPAPLQLTKQALISLCRLEPGLLPGQERFISLHQQDGLVIRALPHAAPSCGLIGARPTGLLGLASAGWHAVWDFAGGLITPRPLYARSSAVVFDLGGGGQTDLFGSSSSSSESAQVGMPAKAPAAAAVAVGMTVSEFQFALPAKMEYVNADDANRTAPPGSALPAPVKVTDWAGAPVQGATVTFTGDAGRMVGTATSDVDGIAQITWPIVAGTNTLRASGRGIAARNNYPEGDVKPFMPDISLPGPSVPRCVPGVACQQAVVLGTGIVPFAATGLAVGITSADVSPTTLEIGGLEGTATVSMGNGTDAAVSGLTVEAWLRQGSARRWAGVSGDPFTCGPGTCVSSFNFVASNEIAGTGTLTCGAAAAEFDLKQDGTLLDTHTLPVTLSQGSPCLTPDQDNDPATETSFSFLAGNLYQSFTPRLSPLAAADLRLRVGSSFPATGIITSINIREGSPDGAVVGSAIASIPGGQTGGTQLAVTFTFAEPITVTPGEVLVIEWLPPAPEGINAGTVLNWMGSDANPYASGNMFAPVLGIVTAFPTVDLNFRTFAAVVTTP
jgi:hypothetical protein